MSDEKKKEPWVMPEWMEIYREFINGHGGNGVDDIMNRMQTEKRLAETNIYVFAMGCEIGAQVRLLHRLKNEGIIV